MRPKSPTRDEAIRILVAGLDDAVLARSFPDQPPEALRRLLTGEPTPSTTIPREGPTVTASGVPPQSAGRCRLFTDGASRGNPGEAGAGAVLYDAADAELTAGSIYLGRCTNNVAEYRALLFGLEEAERLGCRELDISLDSELIVRQLQGRYKVKNETLQILFQQVRDQLTRFTHWSVTHVLRAANARADELANKGIDEKDQHRNSASFERPTS